MKDYSIEYAAKRPTTQGTISPSHKKSEAEMVEIFEEEPCNVWLNSFGGCRSNWLAKGLRAKPHYNPQVPFYDGKGCHYIRPLDVSVDLGIFCYVEDVGMAISSMDGKLETMWHVYEKLLPAEEYLDLKYDIGHWLDLIDKQIDNWTSNPYFPTLIINADSLADEEKYQTFKTLFDLGEEFLPFMRRSTTEWMPSLQPYRRKILKINRKLRSLPDFELRTPL